MSRSSSQISMHSLVQDEIPAHMRLIDELRTATDNEDLDTLDKKVDEWQEFMNRDLPQDVWQEVYLAHPVAIAVRREKQEVVRFLVFTKSLTLDRPCRAMCSCHLCQTLREDSRFHQLWTSRILTSLISWHYIVVAYSNGPIDSCLKTWKAIQKSSLFHGTAHEGMYSDLRKQIDSTIVRCLACTINESEVHFLLCEDEQDDIISSIRKIQDLVSSKMKAAVAHPAVQSLIMTHWGNGADELFGTKFRNSQKVPMIARWFIHLFVFLVLIPVSIVFPHPKLVRFLRSPTIVYANEALSYWALLVILTSAFFYKESNVYYIICRASIRPYHYILAAVILSRFLRTCDGLHHLGLNFFTSPYEIMQSISSCMYFTGLTMLIVASYVVPSKSSTQRVCLNLAYSYAEDKNITENTALHKLLSKPVTQCQAVRAFYELDPAYTHFINNAIEPHNLAALFFSVGHLFYYLSAGNVLYMNRLVCHLNIAVTRMFIDVVRWCLLMLLFYFAWALAMVSLYTNYACENSIFSDVKNAMLEMFWVLFAMTGTTDYKLNGLLKTFDHGGADLIQYTGFVLYASYYIVAQIVLVNLLIALMSVTFQNIEDERIQEMTFWRSKIQLKYIFWHDRSAIPSPFNIFYPVFWMSRAIWKKCLKMREERPTTGSSLLGRGSIVHHENEQKADAHREKVIRFLLKRKPL